MSERSKAYQEGRDAWEDGVDETGNPYDMTTDEALDWNDGWNDADKEYHGESDE